MQYVKKPIAVDAFKWEDINIIPEWFAKAVFEGTVIIDGDAVFIKTLEGVMKAEKGTWIIRGVKGELYPCKAEIFEETYEPYLQSTKD